MIPQSISEYNQTWNRTRFETEYVYDNNLLKSYDWYLKADDDTYVIVENLKAFLSLKDPTEDMAFGFYIHQANIIEPWLSGG